MRFRALVGADMREIARRPSSLFFCLGGPLIVLLFGFLGSHLEKPSRAPMQVSVAVDTATSALPVTQTLRDAGATVRVVDDVAKSVHDRDAVVGARTIDGKTFVVMDGQRGRSREAAAGVVMAIHGLSAETVSAAGRADLGILDVTRAQAERVAALFVFVVVIVGQLPSAIGPFCNDLLTDTKEKRTYEVLLASPLTARELVAGKFAVLFGLGGGSFLLSVAALAFAADVLVRRVPLTVAEIAAFAIIGSLHSAQLVSYFVFLGLRARSGLQAAVVSMAVILIEVGVMTSASRTLFFETLDPLVRQLMMAVPLFGPTVVLAQIVGGVASAGDMLLGVVSCVTTVAVFWRLAERSTSGDQCLAWA